MNVSSSPPTPDPRHIAYGREIPTESYSDQPFVVQTDDGAWLCCITTGPGEEGASGQHVVTLRSTDQGATWSAPLSVEPDDPRENSYAVMLKASSGRVFIFYNHNTDNVREVRRHDGGGVFSRVDSLGHFVFKYSDDHGRSWSRERFDIPSRAFQCDRDNVYGGTLRFFWNVGKPFVLHGKAYVSLHKVGQMGRGFFAQSEGVLLVSDNLLAADDPAAARWETLPDGDIGLRAPAGGGPIAEEQSYCVLSDNTIYCVYRTIAGHPAESTSRDGGRTWSTPRYKCFADGRRMKHPRAANFVWRCRNGRYLYWFHNHGGRFIGGRPDALEIAYEDRNPVWLSAGVEIDTPAGRAIAWSEPEIALYDDDPFVRMSYPDLIEEAGRYFLTETQKDVARVHEIPGDLLEGMWLALESSLGHAITPGAESGDLKECLLALTVAGAALPATAPMPTLPAFRVRDHHAPDYRGKDTGAGFTLELWLRLPKPCVGTVLLDNRDEAGRGFALTAAAGGTLELTLGDGQTCNRWACDPLPADGRSHHVAVIVDGGPRIVSFVIDGRFCDGGDLRQFGWGRFSPHLRHVNGAAELRLGKAVESLHLYGRALRTWEAVGSYLCHPALARLPRPPRREAAVQPTQTPAGS